MDILQQPGHLTTGERSRWEANGTGCARASLRATLLARASQHHKVHTDRPARPDQAP